MPKSPLDSVIEAVQKIQKVHNRAEELRQSLQHVDPLQAATNTLNDLTKKIDQLDTLAAKTKRRPRHRPHFPS